MATRTYREIADGIAREILVGARPVGSRLPPQRTFAYEVGIAPSTASRVYDELRRRGLIKGRVGHGTIVANRFARREGWLQEPAQAAVDLELVTPEASHALSAELSAAAGRAAVEAGWHQASTEGTPALRAAVRADFPWMPPDAGVVFTGRGRQAVAAALTAFVRPGGRLGVEALTYPYLRAFAELRGAHLVPLAMDGEGVMPDALRQAQQIGRLDAVYLQPRIHNPTTRTMGPARRRAIVNTLADLNLVAIEDGVYGFLSNEPPLASEAPQLIVYVESLAKQVSPSLGHGLVVAPKLHAPAISEAARAGAWGPAPLVLALAERLRADGLLTRLRRAKRECARERMAMARSALQVFDIEHAPMSCHLWWRLPDGMSANDLALIARQDGIAIGSGAIFGSVDEPANDAARLSLTHPDQPALEAALCLLGEIVRTWGPEKHR